MSRLKSRGTLRNLVGQGACLRNLGAANKVEVSKLSLLMLCLCFERYLEDYEKGSPHLDSMSLYALWAKEVVQEAARNALHLIALEREPSFEC